ncbi:hypothetical protein CALVIDRAFT_564637 [Calocera viscosa TUFC12733]|uniref:BZIP domain-containing protein n=1 Tax=Calocera viscosa (strain TUFC12733) TaxID=1330018 RepID=A0A167LE11_CALVF|nr:hypothetical protein CALVIDRAFT_564637 [Calocera viscosa TUFC12733]
MSAPSHPPPLPLQHPYPQPPHHNQHQNPAIDPHLQQQPPQHHHNHMYATEYPRPPEKLVGPHGPVTVGGPLGGSPRYQPYPTGLAHQPPPSANIPQPHSDEQSPEAGGAGRVLSTSKRAEQNRKAQRAFRERREQHVKQLESRSQLLDAALASADAANRRYEEARAMVEQLRSENSALRQALQSATTASHPGSNKPSPPRDSKMNGAEPPSSGRSTAPQQPVSDVRSEGRESRASDEEVAEQVANS